jgi:hypothetical protein
MKVQDILRYAIWGAVAITANANRRRYGMNTTWLPHLATNTLTLLLPDALRLLIPRRRKSANFVEQVMVDMVRDNDNYVVYVTPLAAGYILSHPKYNIFKGEVAEKRLLGLGPDAIPHSATGFALTALVVDTLDTACQIEPATGPIAQFAKLCNQKPALVSFGVLSLLTFLWEYAEYRVHEHEMELQGDITKINMMWSGEDTARDVVANFLGWVGALVLKGLKGVKSLN